MDKFKEKYLTRYQKLKLKLKREMNKGNGGLINRLKVMWYRSALERIRVNQMTGGGK